MNKASGGDGIPAELFQILRDDTVKVLHSICPQIWKIQQWPQDWKRLVFIPIPKKINAKECSNYHTIVFISHANKMMLKILQARFQQYVNQKLTNVQMANISWIMEKARELKKKSTSASLFTLNPLTVWITINCEKFLEMGIPDHLTYLLRNQYAGQEATVRTLHGTTD